MMTDQNNNNIQLTVESAKSQDFFQDNNQLGKKDTQERELNLEAFFRILHMLIEIRKISTRFFFFFDVYLLVTKNLNPFSLDRKLADKKKHEMIYMLWKECMPQKFYQHICKEKKFIYLNGKNVL